MSDRSFGEDAHALVVAHRGASATEAENTLAAFEAAVAAGADVVEFDVRITSDGGAVVMHDPDVSRTTDGRGLVKDLSMREVKRLRIGLRDGSTAEVPTLEEALRCCSGRVAVDVEIKNIPGEPDFDGEQQPAVEATVHALNDVAFSGPVLLSSFNPLSIARARTIAPDVATGLLTAYDVEAGVGLGFAGDQGHAWVLPFVDRVREAGPAAIADEAHAKGLRLGTWLEDDPEEVVRLSGAGVDAVATNDPAAAVAALSAGR